MGDGALGSEEVAVVIRFVEGVSGAVEGGDFVDEGWVGDSQGFAVLWDG